MGNQEDISSMLEGVLGSVSKLGEASKAEIPVKDCTDVDFSKLFGDRIYGLLSQDSLSPEQVQLLAALLQVY